eukprot:10138531-Alexandrium_andersonii.AAC.1
MAHPVVVNRWPWGGTASQRAQRHSARALAVVGGLERAPHSCSCFLPVVTYPRLRMRRPECRPGRALAPMVRSASRRG